MYRITPLICAMLIFSFPVVAQVGFDGTSLLKECDAAVRVMDSTGGEAENNPTGAENDLRNAPYCAGLVRGVFAGVGLAVEVGNAWARDTAKAANQKPPATAVFGCKEWSPEQTMRVVDKYLHDHPERLDQEDVLLVIEALTKPCLGDKLYGAPN